MAARTIGGGHDDQGQDEHGSHGDHALGDAGTARPEPGKPRLRRHNPGDQRPGDDGHGGH
ncbi:MAG TPA: hypothetical protein VF469_14080 [Kofleriaceae bacterium]